VGLIEDGFTGGGGILTTNMEYIDSYSAVTTNYPFTASVAGGDLTYNMVSSSDVRTFNEEAISSLWVFDSSEVPILSQTIKGVIGSVGTAANVLSTNTGSLSMTYQVEAFFITSVFDPSLITTLADVLALSTGDVKTFSKYDFTSQATTANQPRKIDCTKSPVLAFTDNEGSGITIYGMYTLLTLIGFTGNAWFDVYDLSIDIDVCKESLRVF